MVPEERKETGMLEWSLPERLRAEAGDPADVNRDVLIEAADRIEELEAQQEALLRWTLSNTRLVVASPAEREILEAMRDEMNKETA